MSSWPVWEQKSGPKGLEKNGVGVDGCTETAVAAGRSFRVRGQGREPAGGVTVTTSSVVEGKLRDRLLTLYIIEVEARILRHQEMEEG